jgi:hypothetical protein
LLFALALLGGGAAGLAGLLLLAVVVEALLVVVVVRVEVLLVLRICRVLFVANVTAEDGHDLLHLDLDFLLLHHHLLPPPPPVFGLVGLDFRLERIARLSRSHVHLALLLRLAKADARIQVEQLSL